ncbi:class I SAM-dependent methyltransferase, partial [bacterium]|nr:class I SAM-dependent methyltransferase [bacterium]
MNNYLVKVDCNCCGRNCTELVYKVKESFTKYPIEGLNDYYFSIVRCLNCGLTYVNPRVKTEKLKEIYKKWLIQENDFKQKDIDPWEDQFLIRLFSALELVSPMGSLLDIGCGWGQLIRFASSLGWKAEGLEIDKIRYDFCRVKGLNALNKDLNEANFSEETFDVVTAIQVLEHLSNPKGTIQLVHHILKRDGVFVIDVPNFRSLSSIRHRANWHIIHPVEHLYYYTYPVLKRMLTDSGFQILPKPVPVNNYQKS